MCVHVCVCVCVLILRANYHLLHVQTFYKQRPKEDKGVGSVHACFSFFQGCQPLLFKDVTLALQSNKTFLVNWLGSPNFSGFWCNSMGKVQYSTCSRWKVHKHVFLSPFFSRQWPGAFCLSRCRGGCSLFQLGSVTDEEKRRCCSGKACVTAPVICFI